MNAKRILPWTRIDASSGRAGFAVQTAIGYYEAWDNGKAFKGAMLLPNRGERDADGAIGVCESDYIARCTEFLNLYNPATHIVVSREAAERWLVRMENAACICRVERANNTANELYESAAELRAALEGGR